MFTAFLSFAKDALKEGIGRRIFSAIVAAGILVCAVVKHMDMISEKWSEFAAYFETAEKSEEQRLSATQLIDGVEEGTDLEAATESVEEETSVESTSEPASKKQKMSITIDGVYSEPTETEVWATVYEEALVDYDSFSVTIDVDAAFARLNLEPQIEEENRHLALTYLYVRVCDVDSGGWVTVYGDRPYLSEETLTVDCDLQGRTITRIAPEPRGRFFWYPPPRCVPLVPGVTGR